MGRESGACPRDAARCSDPPRRSNADEAVRNGNVGDCINENLRHARCPSIAAVASNVRGAYRLRRHQSKVEAELVRIAHPRRYAFHPDEVAEAEAQGLPYVLVPRVLSVREWVERYGAPAADASPGDQ